MSILDHIALFSLLFLSLYVWGIYGSQIKLEIHFWLIAIIPIFFYSFILGSRYGWGPDYMSYKYRMEHAFTYHEEQIGFKILNQGINYLGFSYVGGYVVYSLIFIICAFVLIRSYKKESAYMYGLLIPATLQLATSAIRQGVAMSFVFLAIYFFNKRNWSLMILSVMIGSSIHASIFMTVIIIGVIYLFLKAPINWKISIPLYVFFTFFFSSSSIGFIAEYIQKYITLDNGFQSYIDNADVWFGKEGANDIYEQSSFALILSSLFYISSIYIGYIALKHNPKSKIIYIYNSMVIGILLYRIVFLFEILRRIAEPLIMLNFIVLGFALYSISKVKREIDILNHSKNYIRSFRSSLQFYSVCKGLILIYMILFWGRFVFLNPGAYFFWNK